MPPATFQQFINDTIHKFLDDFVAAYLNDILIDSYNLEVHKVHICQVLGALKKPGIHLNPDKYTFHIQTTKYLGLVLSPPGISMNKEKVAPIQEWGNPANLHDVQAFCGFVKFYRGFTLSYSDIVASHQERQQVYMVPKMTESI